MPTQKWQRMFLRAIPQVIANASKLTMEASLFYDPTN
jgi:hypothetical protein